jgi:hypothetical protein
LDQFVLVGRCVQATFPVEVLHYNTYGLFGYLIYLFIQSLPKKNLVVSSDKKRLTKILTRVN